MGSPTFFREVGICPQVVAERLGRCVEVNVPAEATRSRGIRGDRAHAPHRWPVLRPADLPHVSRVKGTYQVLSTQRVSVAKVRRILIRQVIVGLFIGLDETGGSNPHRHDTRGT